MINESGALLPLDQTPFADEGAFQKLLEKYPELLTGELIDVGKPRRWILVRREVGVPDGKSSAGRWSLDHLFLDQDAVPTLVEVKRAENDEIRRQVVGQILDYAANAVIYWPPDLIRTRFEDRVRASGKHPDEELSRCLGIEADAVEDFWVNVEVNLRNKNVRMLVVADRIPQELRRIVEFLNEQMNPSTFLALELRHFAGEGIRTLVPVVFGQTEQAIQEKSVRRRTPNLSIRDFLEKIRLRLGAEIEQIAQEVINWTEENDLQIRPTAKNLYFGVYNKNRELVEPFSFDTDGRICGQFGQLRSPFGSEESRLVVREKLSAVPGIEFSKAEQYPSSSMARLIPASILAFKDFMGWLRKEVELRENSFNVP